MEPHRLKSVLLKACYQNPCHFSPSRSYATVSRMVTFYRRNLPHWHPPGQDIFVTWRLKGSLPSHLRAIASKDMPGERFLDLARALDRADSGPLWLREPRVAECIVSAFHNLQKQRLIDLHSYAVMANHVHVLLTPVAPMAEITR